MTEELRQRANELHKQITDTQARLAIILNMRDSGNSLTLHDSKVGTVGIQSDSTLKSDVLDAVEHALTKEVQDLVKEYDAL